MHIDFAASARSTVGIEWELALVDAETLELTPLAQPLLDQVDGGEQGPIRQEFLKNMASKVLSADMLYRPQEVADFIGAVADALTVDESLGDLDYVAGLAFSLRNLNPGSGIVMATAPVETYPQDKNRVQLSKKAQAVWDAIIADQPIAPYLDNQSANPINEPVDPSAPATPPAEGEVDPHSEEGILAACQVG